MSKFINSFNLKLFCQAAQSVASGRDHEIRPRGPTAPIDSKKVKCNKDGIKNIW